MEAPLVIDHIAIRSKNRHQTADFLKEFGWEYHTQFDLKFDDGSTTDCLVLKPSDKLYNSIPSLIKWFVPLSESLRDAVDIEISYQLPPEIFISDGATESIVGQWVAKHGTMVHHLAFRVEPKVIEWWLQTKPNMKFLSKEPIICEGLKQIFIQFPDSPLVAELIERTDEGFCRDSVKKLMESTK